MKKSEKQKLMATNAAVWGAGILAAFILPMVIESLSTGPGSFGKVLGFALPLLAGMFFSCIFISKAIGEPTE
jgi:hypothetical protein